MTLLSTSRRPVLKKMIRIRYMYITWITGMMIRKTNYYWISYTAVKKVLIQPRAILT